MDCSQRGSSVHGILQARILGWAAIPPPGDLPHPGFEPASLPHLLHWQAGALPLVPMGSGFSLLYHFNNDVITSTFSVLIY